MQAKDIIDLRITELKQDMKDVVESLKAHEVPTDKNEQFRALNEFKDKILTLKSAICELENIKGKL